MFELHRQALYDSIASDCAFLKGGSLVPMYLTDEDYDFHQEAVFYYYTGCADEDALAVFDGQAREAHLFVPRRGEEHALWFGHVPTQEEIQERFPKIAVHFNDEFDSFIGEYASRRFHVIRDIPQIKNQDNVPNMVNDLKQIAAEHRLFKDHYEIELLREACKVNSEAFVHVLRNFAPGMAEVEAEGMYKQILRKHLCLELSFECMMGAGAGSNVLHHFSTVNVPKASDTFLMDCGCLYQYYCSDHTRTFPVGLRFTPKQEALYKVVLDTNMHAIALCKPGVCWVDVHLGALRKTLEGLRNCGLVKADGDIDEQLRIGVPSVFQPHGLGHLLGLDYHDVGGYTSTIQKNTTDIRLKYLRCGRILQPGMVLTIEPGLYFIDALIERARKNPEVAAHLDFDAIKQWREECAGYRIEDDIVITADGCEVLPGPPKDLETLYELRRASQRE